MDWAIQVNQQNEVMEALSARVAAVPERRAKTRKRVRMRSSGQIAAVDGNDRTGRIA